VLEPNELYRRLVELSPDGILICDDERIVFLNPAAARLFGAASADELLGRPIFDVFRSSGHGLLRDCLARLTVSQTVPPMEAAISRLDGGETAVEVTGILLAEAGGRAIQLIVRDITERTRAEAALRES
jgi:PAS domain S-box-containing protein